MGWAEGPASFYVLTTLVAASAADASTARAYQGLNGGLADETKDGLETMLKASRSLQLPMTRDTRIALFLIGEMVAALRANYPDTFT